MFWVSRNWFDLQYVRVQEIGILIVKKKKKYAHNEYKEKVHDVDEYGKVYHLVGNHNSNINNTFKHFNHMFKISHFSLPSDMLIGL